MIDLYYWPTPNGWKISIMLEECALPYKLVPVNIGTGDQFKPEFLKISPNNRMPAIVDHEPPGRRCGGVGVRIGRHPAVPRREGGQVSAEGPARQVRDPAMGQLADGRAGTDGGPGQPLQCLCSAVQSAPSAEIWPGPLHQRGQPPVRRAEQA